MHVSYDATHFWLFSVVEFDVLKWSVRPRVRAFYLFCTSMCPIYDLLFCSANQRVNILSNMAPFTTAINRVDSRRVFSLCERGNAPTPSKGQVS